MDRSKYMDIICKAIVSAFLYERERFVAERSEYDLGTVYVWDDIRNHFADHVRDEWPGAYRQMSSVEYGELLEAVVDAAKDL